MELYTLLLPRKAPSPPTFTYSEEDRPHLEALKRSLGGDISVDDAYTSYLNAMTGGAYGTDRFPALTQNIESLINTHRVATNSVLNAIVEKYEDIFVQYVRMIQERRSKLGLSHEMLDTLAKALYRLRDGETIALHIVSELDGRVSQIMTKLTNGTDIVDQLSRLLGYLESKSIERIGGYTTQFTRIDLVESERIIDLDRLLKTHGGL